MCVCLNTRRRTSSDENRMAQHNLLFIAQLHSSNIFSGKKQVREKFSGQSKHENKMVQRFSFGEP